MKWKIMNTLKYNVVVKSSKVLKSVMFCQLYYYQMFMCMKKTEDSLTSLRRTVVEKKFGTRIFCKELKSWYYFMYVLLPYRGTRI